MGELEAITAGENLAGNSLVGGDEAQQWRSVLVEEPTSSFAVRARSPGLAELVDGELQLVEHADGQVFDPNMSTPLVLELDDQVEDLETLWERLVVVPVA